MDPVVVNIYEAKKNLSGLLRRVAAGEQVIIAKANRPIARLVPFTEPRPVRIPDKYADLITISEDFDAPLPAEVLNSFYETSTDPS